MFGNDGIKESFLHVVAPVVVAGRAILLAFSVVRSDSLALLIGKDQMRKFGIVLEVGSGIIHMGRTRQEMVLSRVGHDGCPLRPERWRELVAEQQARGDFTVPKETLDLTGQVAAMDVDADARGQVAMEVDAESPDGDVLMKPTFSTRRKALGNERIQRLAVTARKVADKQAKEKQAKRPGLIRSLLAGMVALTSGTGPAYFASSAVVPAAESAAIPSAIVPMDVDDEVEVLPPVHDVCEFAEEDKMWRGCSMCSIPADEESGSHCIACEGWSCGRCKSDVVCHPCNFGWSRSPTGPAYEEQVKKIKAGSTVMLNAGKEHARVLAEHGVAPHFVAQVL